MAKINGVPSRRVSQGIPQMAQLLRPSALTHQGKAVPMPLRELQVGVRAEDEPQQAPGAARDPAIEGVREIIKKATAERDGDLSKSLHLIIIFIT